VLNKNEVANLALGRLGVSLSIVDLDTENSTQAKIIRRHYKISLETLLERHGWNFATKYAPLLLQANDPNLGFSYQYALPADCLILREIAADGIFPEVNLYEEQKEQWQEVYTGASPSIYSNTKNAHAKYTVKIPETMAMPNHFGRALAAQLSIDIAPSLITNNFGKVRDTLNSAAINDIHLGIAQDLGRQPLQLDSLSPFHRARF
jgi:hypothetical protein